MLSGVVLTKNEGKNIEECLKAFSFCDEILVIDDFSTDKTVELGKKAGARVFKRHLDNDFAAQRNFALEKTKGDWVLFVDADERVDKKLASEIEKAIKAPHINGFYLKRRDFLWGRELRFGESGKMKLLRLGRKGAGLWQRKIHETWQIEGEKGILETPLQHYPHQTITEFLKEINFYSTLHSQEKVREGEKATLFKVIFFPLGKFIKNYFVNLGFLDGMPGLIVALMMSLHSFLSWSKEMNLEGGVS